MRIFLGIPLPLSFFNKIKALQEIFKKDYPNIKFVTPENTHLTIKFFGEISEQELQKVIIDISKFSLTLKPFEITLQKVKTFAEKYPQTLWIDIKEKEQLSKLFKPFNKDFIPHITIGRIKHISRDNSLIHELEKAKNIELGSFKVEALFLYESKLSSQGPRYKVLKEFHFGEKE